MKVICGFLCCVSYALTSYQAYGSDLRTYTSSSAVVIHNFVADPDHSDYKFAYNGQPAATDATLPKNLNGTNFTIADVHSIATGDIAAKDDPEYRYILSHKAVATTSGSLQSTIEKEGVEGDAITRYQFVALGKQSGTGSDVTIDTDSIIDLEGSNGTYVNAFGNVEILDRNNNIVFNEWYCAFTCSVSSGTNLGITNRHASFTIETGYVYEVIMLSQIQITDSLFTPHGDPIPATLNSDVLTAKASVDPYFSIDSSVADADQYSFVFSPGIFNVPEASAVPESATWVMMIAGFSGLGLVMRRRWREDGPCSFMTEFTA